MFYTFITVLILLASIALVLIVMVQKSKGGGLAAGFASSNNIMGVRKTTDLLEKLTWWFMGTIMALSIAATAFMPKGGSVEGDELQRSLERKAATPVATPGIPALGGTTPKAQPATTPAEQPQSAEPKPAQ